jgi:predicted ferric reductase
MKKGRIEYLGAVVLVIVIFVLGLESLQSPSTPIQWTIRSAALLGYFCTFGAIVTSAAMRQMVRLFGRSFIKVHHILSITGLVLVTIHPLAVAWQAASLNVFIPSVSSWRSFFVLGGRPAWYLFGIGSLIAVLRGVIGKNWKLIHYLNYLAFWLATIHGILIGSNVQSLGMRILFGTLALIVLTIFVLKRSSTRQKRRR